MFAWRLTAGLVGMLLLSAMAAPAAFAQLRIEEQFNTSGVVEAITADTLVIRDENGKSHRIKFHGEEDDGVRLASGTMLRYPAKIQVRGSYSPESLKPGARLKFRARLNRLGRSDGQLDQLTLLDADAGTPGIEVIEQADDPSDYSTCEVIGDFKRIVRNRLIVEIPAEVEFTRRTSLTVQLAEGSKVAFDTKDAGKASAGAKVPQLEFVRLNTGDFVASNIVIEVTDDTTAVGDFDDELLEKYRDLDDTPKKTPRLIRSRHFAFMTDVSDREAQIILDKLEVMAELLTGYFGRAPTGIVEGYIVEDLSVWPDGLLKEPQGVAKIREQAGVCFSTTLGRVRRATLYSCNDHGVIQHECTHGFCHMAFGSTGPTWLSEGVAEMGQYWKLDQQGVDVGPHVVNYLRQAEPKRQLLHIAVPGRTDAGGWQDYAWRWALCHLLANNPNYADRFKPLAVALMEKREGVSFRSVYGPVAKEVSFEYDQFLKVVDNGYRADLCAWPWQAKFAPLAANRRKAEKIKANYGWQASGVTLNKGISYDIAAVGTWKIAPGGLDLEADGDDQDRGKLMGVLFKDYELSEPFPIGKLARFEAPADGQLFLRCQDEWHALADNEGEIEVHIRQTPK